MQRPETGRHDKSYTIDRTAIGITESCGFSVLVAVGYGGKPLDKSYRRASPRHLGYAVLMGNADGGIAGVLRIEEGCIVVDSGDDNPARDCLYMAARDSLPHLYNAYVAVYGKKPHNMFYRHACGGKVERAEYSTEDAENDYFTYG